MVFNMIFCIVIKGFIFQLLWHCLHLYLRTHFLSSLWTADELTSAHVVQEDWSLFLAKGKTRLIFHFNRQTSTRIYCIGSLLCSRWCIFHRCNQHRYGNTWVNIWTSLKESLQLNFEPAWTLYIVVGELFRSFIQVKVGIPQCKKFCIQNLTYCK